MPLPTALPHPIAEPNSQPQLPVLLDLQHLARQTLGIATLRSEVLGMFETELAGFAEALRAAPDARTWQRLAHTMKGVSMNLGAFALADQCRAIERLDLAPGSAARAETIEGIAAGIARTRMAIAAARLAG